MHSILEVIALAVVRGYRRPHPGGPMSVEHSLRLRMRSGQIGINAETPCRERPLGLVKRRERQKEA